MYFKNRYLILVNFEVNYILWEFWKFILSPKKIAPKKTLQNHTHHYAAVFIQEIISPLRIPFEDPPLEKNSKNIDFSPLRQTLYDIPKLHFFRILEQSAQPKNS